MRARARGRNSLLDRSGPKTPRRGTPRHETTRGRRGPREVIAQFGRRGRHGRVPPPEISCARELARGVFACRDSGPPAGATRAVALAVGARTSHICARRESETAPSASAFRPPHMQLKPSPTCPVASRSLAPSPIVASPLRQEGIKNGGGSKAE